MGKKDGRHLPYSCRILRNHSWKCPTTDIILIWNNCSTNVHSSVWVTQRSWFGLIVQIRKSCRALWPTCPYLWTLFKNSNKPQRNSKCWNDTGQKEQLLRTVVISGPTAIENGQEPNRIWHHHDNPGNIRNIPFLLSKTQTAEYEVLDEELRNIAATGSWLQESNESGDEIKWWLVVGPRRDLFRNGENDWNVESFHIILT